MPKQNKENEEKYHWWEDDYIVGKHFDKYPYNNTISFPKEEGEVVPYVAYNEHEWRYSPNGLPNDKVIKHLLKVIVNELEVIFMYKREKFAKKDMVTYGVFSSEEEFDEWFSKHEQIFNRMKEIIESNDFKVFEKADVGAFIKHLIYLRGMSSAMEDALIAGQEENNPGPSPSDFLPGPDMDAPYQPEELVEMDDKLSAKIISELRKIADYLDSNKHLKEADIIDQAIVALADKKKWMQDAVNPKEKGELHKKLNIPEDEKIPTSLLKKKKRELQERAKGDKKLSKADRETLNQIQFALNARKAK